MAMFTYLQCCASSGFCACVGSPSSASELHPLKVISLFMEAAPSPAAAKPTWACSKVILSVAGGSKTQLSAEPHIVPALNSSVGAPGGSGSLLCSLPFSMRESSSAFTEVVLHPASSQYEC